MESKIEFYRVSAEMEKATIEELKKRIERGENVGDGELYKAHARLRKYNRKIQKHSSQLKVGMAESFRQPSSTQMMKQQEMKSNRWTPSTPWHEDEGDDISDLQPISWKEDMEEKALEESEIKEVIEETKTCIRKQMNCKHCHKSFDNYHNLKVHRLTHTAERQCERCERIFSRGYLLRRHLNRDGCRLKTTCDTVFDGSDNGMRTVETESEKCVDRNVERQCEGCNHIFCTDYALQQHIKRGVCGNKRRAPPLYTGRTNDCNNATLACSVCNQQFCTQYQLHLHELVHSKHKDILYNNTAKIELQRHSIKSSVRDYIMNDSQGISDAVQWLTVNKILIDQIFNHLDDFLLKAMIIVKLKFVKTDHYSGVTKKKFNFYVNSGRSDMVEDNDLWFDRHLYNVKTRLENLEENESSLEFEGIENITLKLNLLENYHGKGHFQLPKKLQGLQALINVDSPKNCFKYAVLSILHYNDIKRDRQRVSKYEPYEDELKFDKLDSNSMKIKNIRSFERQNKIKVNVHVWDGKLRGVRYNARDSIYDRTVNLLLIYNEKDQSSHYVGITSISKLYKHIEEYKHKFHYCDRCLRRFTVLHVLEKHYEWCKKGKLQIENMPKDDEFSYKENGNELSPLCVVYADIECYIEDGIHKPAAIACYEKWHEYYDSKSKMHIWQGENCIVEFLKFLDNLVRYQHNKIEKLTRKPLSMTRDDYDEYDRHTHCQKCFKLFDDTQYRKCRDHDHITGKYRSALCSRCNFRLQLKRRILPIIFHNFKSYDAHVLISEGFGKMKEWKLEVIAQTKEKFMCVTSKIPVGETSKGKTLFGRINFIDSFQFMSSSLANLVQNLNTLPITSNLKNDYPNVNDELLKRKGIFPYSYFKALDQLCEIELPPIQMFRNDLTDEECSLEDYNHAQLAWHKFDCQTFGDFMIAYLKLDVYLLADVFEAFRKVALTEDQLDPVQFISLPSMSYMSAFKMTGEKIHLLHDPEQYNLFERGIRGGLTFVNKHQINYMETENETTHLKYIDQNNLYGSSLSKPLPHSNFKWIDDNEIEYFNKSENISMIEDEGEEGYLFEVDLVYPDELKYKTEDFPLAPESGYITKDMFSSYMNEYNDIINNSKYIPTRKLLLDQFDKENYIVHYSILKFYLEMGMQLKKLHRGIKFTQKRFLKKYIDYNSSKRQNAKNSFEKDFYKLKNNALFGKTMEDVRKRIDYRLSNDLEKTKKLCSSPLFHHTDIINEDLTGIKMTKQMITLDKPIYIGQAVLDYSKLEMYTLFYKTLKTCPKIRDVRLLGGDTDSFFLSITISKQEHINNIFKVLQTYLDSSNFPISHPLYSIKNKAKLGCFKDECAGEELSEMILLRPKMYSMKFKSKDTSIKRAKGVSKSIVKKLKHQEFKKVFTEQDILDKAMTIIKSDSHHISTHTFKKRALSAWDDKRCWMHQNISLPHGHPDTQIPPPKKRKLSLPVCGDVD